MILFGQVSTILANRASADGATRLGLRAKVGKIPNGLGTVLTAATLTSPVSANLFRITATLFGTAIRLPQKFILQSVNQTVM